MEKALYYEKLEDDCVKCILCPRECTLEPGQVSYCRAKINREGELYSTIYAQISSIAMDPIEKKPLYHFCPGSDILSVGTVGCNLQCQFCQNWHIAHREAETRELSSEQLVKLALRYEAVGIAFTYSEPLIWYEYLLHTALKAREAGLKTVLVTNGLIQKDALRELLQYIDAVNLDVKAFQGEFYQNVCGGNYLQTIKESAEVMSEMCHLEVATLLIPGLNDDPAQLRELAQWLAGLSPDHPLHLSRYFPQYKLNLPPTPLESMQRAKEIAKEHLRYVYLGNLANEERHTYCYQCHYPVVQRNGRVQIDLDDGCCPKCGAKISVIL